VLLPYKTSQASQKQKTVGGRIPDKRGLDILLLIPVSRSISTKTKAQKKASIGDLLFFSVITD
jgi:hypothetical protein